MKKGVNTFAAFQEERQAVRAAHIKKYLSTLPKREKFSLITDLAEKVAEYVTSQDSGRRPCSKVTILRNSKYRSLLENHMRHTPGVSAEGASLSHIRASDPPVVLLLQTEIANLKRENRRLKHYVESGIKNGEHAPNGEPQRAPYGKQAGVDETELHLIQTFQLLMKLLDYLQNSLAISKNDQTIIDLSKMRNNVVAGHPLTLPFFRWLEETKSNLGSRPL